MAYDLMLAWCQATKDDRHEVLNTVPVEPAFLPHELTTTMAMAVGRLSRGRLERAIGDGTLRVRLAGPRRMISTESLLKLTGEPTISIGRYLQALARHGRECQRMRRNAERCRRAAQ